MERIRLIWDAVVALREPRCYKGGIWCCSRLSVSPTSFIHCFLPSSIISLIKNKQAWRTKLHSSALLIIPAELGEDRQNLCIALLPSRGRVIYSTFQEGYSRLHMTSDGIHRTEKQKDREHLY